MSPSGKTLFYFGIYVVSAGLLFLSIPETLISLTQLPPMPTGWTRVIGLLALVIGAYDILAGKHDVKPLIKASVYVRLGFALGIVLLVALGQMPLPLLLFGAADGLAALWTAMVLKSEASKTGH